MMAFISSGAIQLLVGPASFSSTEQMKVRSSTRATSVGSDWARKEFGFRSGLSRVKVPLATRASVSCSHSSSSPVHQCTRSGWVRSATSCTQERMPSWVVAVSEWVVSIVMAPGPLTHPPAGRRMATGSSRWCRSGRCRPPHRCSDVFSSLGGPAKGARSPPSAGESTHKVGGPTIGSIHDVTPVSPAMWASVRPCPDRAYLQANGLSTLFLPVFTKVCRKSDAPHGRQAMGSARSPWGVRRARLPARVDRGAEMGVVDVPDPLVEGAAQRLDLAGGRVAGRLLGRCGRPG